MPKRLRFLALFASVCLVLPACTRTPAAEPLASPTPSDTPASSPTASPTPKPAAFDADRAMADIRHLAEAIGIREAGSAGFRAAADWAATKLAGYGYKVGRQTV